MTDTNLINFLYNRLCYNCKHEVHTVNSECCENIHVQINGLLNKLNDTHEMYTSGSEMDDIDPDYEPSESYEETDTEFEDVVVEEVEVEEEEEEEEEEDMDVKEEEEEDMDVKEDVEVVEVVDVEEEDVEDMDIDVKQQSKHLIESIFNLKQQEDLTEVDVVIETATDNAVSNEKLLDNIKSEEFIKYMDLIPTLEPNIKEMLCSDNLLPEDKIKLTEKYICLLNGTPCTLEWIETREHILEFYKEKTKHKDDIMVEKLLEDPLQSQSIPKRISELNTDIENKRQIYKKYKQMENYDPSDSEYGKLKSWIDISLQLPFDNVKELKTDNQTNFIKYIKESLDKELYGLTEVKEQILLFLNSRMNNPNLKGCNLALLGEPGCGKTALSRSLSRILDLPFSQISFGGINDVNFLKGHDLTYIGSKPGEIAQSMIRLKNKNGILFLDEFDKVSNNNDIISSLLHVTDPEQNHSYRDNYLSDLVIDLSSVWWIYSMNEYPKNKALKDRLFIIKLPEYSVNDKVNIIKKFSIKKILKTLGLEDDTFTISDEACNCIINNYIDSSDKGIRNIQKILSDVIQKLLFKYKHKDEITLSVKTNNVTLPYEISSKDIRKLVKNDKKNMNYMYV